MSETSRPCDPDQLRRLLDDRLNVEEHDALSAHLEQCEICRRKLESLAAASGLWGDVRLLGYPPGPVPGLARTFPMVPEGSSPDLTDDEELGFFDPPTQPGSLGCFGPYEVLEILGRGGMGVVFKAHDPNLNRQVAVKVLAPALATTGTARRRFAREAKAAAAVAHEHIVPIHAVDEFHGLPYIVMHYVAGRSLQQQLDQSGPLEVPEILRIGMQAASALAAAHAQGVVHRDVKPGNILLENCVQRVRLTDFGLARVADDASLTHSGVIAGTPQYMAPEQARGEPVDARADLYALGAVLYAICTGRSPFRADSTMAVLKRVCEEAPRPIQDINPDVPEWLVAMINRLMAKNPTDRYASASEVSERLAAGLAHLQQPKTCPPPEISQSPTPAPARRHPKRRLALAAAVLISVLGVGLGAGGGQGLAQVADFVATVLKIKTPNGTLVVEVGDPEVKVRVDDEDVVISGAGPQEIRLSAGTHRFQATRNGQPVRDELITITRGGKEVVTVSVESLGTEPAGRSIPKRTKNEEASTHLIRTMEGHTGPVSSVAFSPDGKTILSGSGWPWGDRTLRLWEVATGEEIRRFETARNDPGPDTHGPREVPGEVQCLAIIPDGRRALSGETGGIVQLWDLETGREIRRLLGHTGTVYDLAISPDGQRALTGGRDKTARLWDLDTGREIRRLEGHAGWIRSVAFLPDDRRALTGAGPGDPTVKLWDLETGRELKSVEMGGIVRDLAIAPDGLHVLAAVNPEEPDAPGVIVVLGLHNGLEIMRRITGHRTPVINVAISPDGHQFLTASYDGIVRRWDRNGRELDHLLGHGNWVWSVAYSPDGKLAVSGGGGTGGSKTVAPGQDFTLRLWDLKPPPPARLPKPAGNSTLR